MRLIDLLNLDHLHFDLRASDKAQVLHQLARHAATELGLEENIIFQELSRREALGSTGVGKGFALPHARIAGLPHPFVLLARLSRPIAFDAVDGRPVDLLALLLTPPGADSEHLARLAAISRPLRDETVLQRLRTARNVAQAHEILSGIAGDS